MPEFAMFLPLASAVTPATGATSGGTTTGITAERPSGTSVVAPPPGGETTIGAATAPAALTTGTATAATPTTTSTAPATQGAGGAAGPGGIFGSLGTLLPIILMFVVLYFVLFRGQRKEEKKRKAMISEVKKGDRVMTIGGMMAKVVSVDGDEVVLKVDEAANVKATYRKSAIQEVIDRDEKK